MKNKKIFYSILFIIFYFNLNYLHAKQLTYEADEIEITQSGNLIEGKNNVEIKIDKHIVINAEKFKYDKQKKILILNNNVNYVDDKNKISLKTNEILYLESIDTIKSKLLTNLSYADKYFIKLREFEYFLNENEISSNKVVEINENNGNYFQFLNFKFNLNSLIYYGEKFKHISNEQNEYFLENAFVNLRTNEIYGKDISVEFNKNLFSNKENDPRIKARGINLNDDNYIINKGVFTSCKKNDNCPPWSIYAEEINYKKSLETINYKNAWLKIYDFPLLYLPRFSHPSPSVDRKSGFLAPKFSNSNNLGQSIDVPYFYAISENKDLTIKPKIFFNNEAIIQNEYRQFNKESKHILDFSLNPNNYLQSNNQTKFHFFSNSKINLHNEIFDYSQIEINLQKVNNDEYLKLYKISNPNLKNYENNVLHSYINFDGTRDDIIFSTSAELIEDLSKKKSDRFEMIYPSFNFQKNLSINGNSLFLRTYGNQKKYATNIDEKILINDLYFNGNKKIFNSGFTSNFNSIIKNTNIDAKNSEKYKDKFEQTLVTSLQYNVEYPLKNEEIDYSNYLNPKISFMYSPNKSKNITNEKRKTDVSNIFSFNRIGTNETVEGGESITLGAEYNKIRKSDKLDVFNLEMATSFRFNENLDLPANSTLNKKTSDFVGKLIFNPSKKFGFAYNFSLDNNLNKSNYDNFITTLSVNNFVTTFEYANDKIENETDSYTSSNTKYNLNENVSFDFNFRRNNEYSATEFYNLVYNYKNDCMTASISYNKEFYRDSDLKPEKQLLFSISIIPFNNSN